MYIDIFFENWKKLLTFVTSKKCCGQRFWVILVTWNIFAKAETYIFFKPDFYVFDNQDQNDKSLTDIQNILLKFQKKFVWSESSILGWFLDGFCTLNRFLSETKQTFFKYQKLLVVSKSCSFSKDCDKFLF